MATKGGGPRGASNTDERRVRSPFMNPIPGTYLEPEALLRLGMVHGLLLAGSGWHAGARRIISTERERESEREREGEIQRERERELFIHLCIKKDTSKKI